MPLLHILEISEFACYRRQVENLRQNVVRRGNGPLPSRFTKKIFLRQNSIVLETPAILLGSLIFLFCYLFLDPLGNARTKKRSFTPYTARTAVKPNSRLLSLSTFWPNRRNRANWAADGTRQPPMPSSYLNPLNFLLRLAHPVRNNENPNQLLDSHTPTLSQILQFEENPAI